MWKIQQAADMCYKERSCISCVVKVYANITAGEVNPVLSDYAHFSTSMFSPSLPAPSCQILNSWLWLPAVEGDLQKPKTWMCSGNKDIIAFTDNNTSNL